MDQIERDMRLQEGKIVGNFWFNENTAHSFMTLVTFAQVNQIPKVQWPNKDRQWVDIPTVQAVQMCAQIISELQEIYQASHEVVSGAQGGPKNQHRKEDQGDH